MGLSFDPKDPKHQSGNFIQAPGRYVMHIETINRKMTRKEQHAIVTHCKVLLGPKAGAEIRRLFMLEGGGTRWTADLFNAVGSNGIEDVLNDVELSMAMGKRPFAAQCDWGDVQVGKTNAKGEPLRYMEVQEVFPVDNNEMMELQRSNYLAGMRAGTSIVEEEKKRTDSGPRDDVPHPADMDGSGKGDGGSGPKQGSEWPDDIPF